MGTITLRFLWLIQIMNYVSLCVACFVLPALPDLTSTCFLCAGVTKKYSYLTIGYEVPFLDYLPIFAGKYVKAAHAVDSDKEAPFVPDCKRVKTTVPTPPPLPPPHNFTVLSTI